MQRALDIPRNEVHRRLPPARRRRRPSAVHSTRRRRTDSLGYCGTGPAVRRRGSGERMGRCERGAHQNSEYTAASSGVPLHHSFQSVSGNGLSGNDLSGNGLSGNGSVVGRAATPFHLNRRSLARRRRRDRCGVARADWRAAASGVRTPRRPLPEIPHARLDVRVRLLDDARADACRRGSPSPRGAGADRRGIKPTKASACVPRACRVCAECVPRACVACVRRVFGACVARAACVRRACGMRACAAYVARACDVRAACVWRVHAACVRHVCGMRLARVWRVRAACVCAACAHRPPRRRD